MADVSTAGLLTIEAMLAKISTMVDKVGDGIVYVNKNIEIVDGNVDSVGMNVQIVQDAVTQLAGDFHDFVSMQTKANAYSKAQQKIIQIRQEIEKKFGHYDVVRRTATGILQADDLGIVKSSTISNATEELMITTPGYWLAPCLVALAAWINNQPELADRALRESIKRNDEKTSLFFALVCRRADRKAASIKWTQRYLEKQDEENLDRETIIILDAFAGGLLGADSEGAILKQLDVWLAHLEEKPGFVEQQTKQWTEAINLKKVMLASDKYKYLRKYSKTWPQLQSVMEGAMLHAEILNYFVNIFEQENSTDSLKAQLDEILNTLVTGFDDEELPYMKEEKFNQFVIDFEGDEDRARQNMLLEENAFETQKDFTQLLTDAAMSPELSHANVSTQKFAIALSKDWISNAYNDVVASNRMKIPHEIEINVDTFNDKTVDGKDEVEVLQRFNALVDKEKAKALENIKLTSSEKFCLGGGIVIAIIGLVLCCVGILKNGDLKMLMLLGGAIATISGIGMVIKYFSRKKQVEMQRVNLIKPFEEKRESGCTIIRALLAEIVDFRAEFEEKDSESQKVIDFLEQISPEQYLSNLSESGSRIKMI